MTERVVQANWTSLNLCEVLESLPSRLVMLRVVVLSTLCNFPLVVCGDVQGGVRIEHPVRKRKDDSHASARRKWWGCRYCVVWSSARLERGWVDESGDRYGRGARPEIADHCFNPAPSIYEGRSKNRVHNKIGQVTTAARNRPPTGNTLNLERGNS